MEALELVKENMQPLRRGRTLRPAEEEAGESSERERAAALEAERSAFQAELAAYTGDDPLSVWLRYLAWTQLKFPAGGPGSQLLATLEHCTRELLPLPRYRDDIRYLRVWVQYADCCTEPKEIFDFLEHHGIGQDFALFYEARAAFLELRGNYAQAEAAYQSGLNRQAQPLQRLRTKFAAFEARMAQRELRKQADAALGIVEDAPARETLASRPVPSTLQRGGAFANSSNTGDARGQKRAQGNRCDGLDIYVDDAQEGGRAAPAPKAAWNSLSSQADTRKENQQAPSAWNGVRVPQGRAAAPRAAAAAAFTLDVYEDEELADVAAEAAPRAPPAHVPLRKKLEDEVSALHRNPVLAHATSLAAPPPQRAAPAAAQPARPALSVDAAAPLSVAELQRLTDTVQLSKSRDGGETSFEEGRAAAWLARSHASALAAAAAAAAAAPPPPAPAAAVPEAAPSPMREAAHEPLAVLHVAAPEPGVQPLAPPAAPLASPAPAFRPPPSAERPTAPRSLDAAPQPPPRFQMAADMTVNMRDAYADIMTMFSDALPAAPRGGRSAAAAAPPAGSASARSATAPRAARPEPLFEIYDGEEDADVAPAAPAAGVAVAPAAADAFTVLEDDAAADAAAGVSGAAEDTFPDDGENADPLGAENAVPLPALAARRLAGSPDSALQPWGAAALAAVAAAPPDDEEEAALHAAAEAAMRSCGGGDAAAADDSFEVYEDPEMSPPATLPVQPPPLATASGSHSADSGAFAVYEDEPEMDSDAAAAVPPPLPMDAAPPAPAAAPLAADAGFSVFEEFPEESAGHGIATDAPAAAAIPPAADVTGEVVYPFAPGATAALLAALEEPVATLHGVTQEAEDAAGRLEAALSAARRRPRSGVLLQLGGFRYLLGRLCGRGAFADIYEAVDEDDAADADAVADAPAAALALKVVRPPDAAAVDWEFLVLRRVAERVAPAARPLFLQARRLHAAGPLVVLVAPFGPHGTLQDAVNTAMATAGASAAMPEVLAMWFTVELLRCLEALHAAGFIHADVKPDNVLLRLGGGADAASDEEWSDAWTPARPGCWRARGVSLIDFGRAIDLGAYPPGTVFAGDCGTDNFRCVEMMTDRPWTLQADTFGALGCVHAMLFGSYLEVDYDDLAARWRRREPLKRYWAAALWEPFFDALLNVPTAAVGVQPDLAPFRAAFEQHLAAPERARELREALMQLTIAMADAAAKAAKAG